MDETLEFVEARIAESTLPIICSALKPATGLDLFYTCGISQRGGYDLAIVGPGPDMAGNVLMAVANDLYVGKITELPEEGWKVYTDDENLAFIVKAMDLTGPLGAYFSTGMAFSEVSKKPFRVAQIFWTDDNGNVEGEAGFDPDLVGMQSLAFTATADKVVLH